MLRHMCDETQISGDTHFDVCCSAIGVHSDLELAIRRQSRMSVVKEEQAPGGIYKRYSHMVSGYCELRNAENPIYTASINLRFASGDSRHRSVVIVPEVDVHGLTPRIVRSVFRTAVVGGQYLAKMGKKRDKQQPLLTL